MAEDEGTSFPTTAKPYTWDESQIIPPDTLRLWTEVGNGIETSQTVVWKSAVESLDQANKYIRTSKEARAFVEKYMFQIISILVEQQPTKIGPHERNCVQESLAQAVTLIACDLELQMERNGESTMLNVLTLIFNKKKAYYKGNKGNFHANHLSGLPEVRLRMIDRFREERGFARLREYMLERIGTPTYPIHDVVHQVLVALSDNLPSRNPSNGPADSGPADIGPAGKDMEEAAIGVAKATMQYISSCSDEDLKKLPSEQLITLQRDLRRIFDRLVPTRRDDTYEFYEFWRGLVLKLITSQSLPLKLFGWQQMEEILAACSLHRPPPRSFDVTDAGCTFVNGKYEFAGTITEEGYAHQGADVSYERIIPNDVEDGGGKKLTLFRCTMRSQQKWWFLSEADEEQPGTDRDIDYYQHKSKEHEETEPPPRGWVTCRNSGVDPPPKLRSIGLMVPPGEEFNTLEHLLAQWAIENGIIELVLGDSAHREVVARSTALIKFLASMCDRDRAPAIANSAGKTPNMYCLQTSHLLLAWKTCTRNTDAAVSAQVYQLLVSILPSCPGSLANPLLQEMQRSLAPKKEKRHNLLEVAEFCSILATANFSDPKSNAGMNLADDVRSEVLQLLWAVLTHQDASTLKNYDSIKRYVTTELRVEPMGTKHRESYLRACINSLSANARKQGDEAVDEAQALGMVKLTLFVLEACPREQAISLIMRDRGALPALLFNELTSFLRRRHSANDAKNPATRKAQSEQDLLISSSLSERLEILRYVFGISEQVFMTSQQLRDLWQLCAVEARDQEELMIFIANAAGNGHRGSVATDQTTLLAQNSTGQSNDTLFPVFTDETSYSAFLKLFCSPSVGFDALGEGAYRSFQSLFSKLRLVTGVRQDLTAAAIDALWRISLRAANNSVAYQAMKDLMSLYIAGSGDIDATGTDRMETDATEESFGKRVFECLLDVRKGLKVGLGLGDVSAELAAERCLRILNAAIGQDGNSSSSITSSTLARIEALSPASGLRQVLKFIPHGMRGQACCRKIGVTAKRTNMPNMLPPQPVQHPQPSPISRDDVGPRAPTTLRFSLSVHPLETLLSVKSKVAKYCQCPITMVRPVSITGRAIQSDNRNTGTDMSQLSLNVVPDDSVMDEIGIVQGCEIIFVIAEQRQQMPHLAQKNKARNTGTRDLSSIFFSSNDQFSNELFQTLFDVLELILSRETDAMTDSSVPTSETRKLIWDLLMAMPTNSSIASLVRASAREGDAAAASVSDDDAMETDSKQETWPRLLDLQNFQRSVYNLIAIDAALQPSPEAFTSLPQEQRMILDREMINDAVVFRRGFIDSGGFDAVVRFFSDSNNKLVHNRMGNAVALRILKCCLFGDSAPALGGQNSSEDDNALDDVGARLLESLSDAQGLLKSLAKMVVDDSGISTSTISDVLRFLQLLFRSQQTAKNFVDLPDSLAENFLVSLLLWEGEIESSRHNSAMSAVSRVRRDTHDLILKTPALADHSLPWLIKAIDSIEVVSESTQEYFDVLQKLIADERSSSRTHRASPAELSALATAVCKKLSSCPRPATMTAMANVATGVLCGCLILLRRLIENGGATLLREGTAILIKGQKVARWSEMIKAQPKGMFSLISFRGGSESQDAVLVDLMGVIFDAYLSPGGSSSVVAICCDKPSRQFGFNVVDAAARACSTGDGYIALVNRINGLISSASPHLRHRWNQNGGTEGHSRSGRHASIYSGLRNQGCTCYMNSLLQQLFMMPELRKSICAAPLPIAARSSGGAASTKGAELVGKRLSMQWENGVAYDAMVEGYDEDTGMHTIRYCPIQIATVAEANHQQVHPDDIAKLPPLLPDELFLSEGRPGKETGAFEVVNTSLGKDSKSEETKNGGPESAGFEETDDEASSRYLLEEVQRTFIHLDEGSRGRCFDPRALVEASACLKLEFDVWQQNDASEYATKLLDRLEMPLKRWAPDHFRYLDHTFGLKQTKQKICKECGLKTNREEKLLNIDCQIRGKADIHEALGTMTEVEVMEGSNQVFCDRCKKNTDTILRTAISSLPNMLILSLKRFDLDYNTFETVKLNSRCAFGQTLNMKQYTLDGLEAVEQSGSNDAQGTDPSPMDTENGSTSGVRAESLEQLPDEDYEYKLAGVLVHAGVAQGGHYYSFIKDRSSTSKESWYRFDDDDVTPFDPASIEAECFGGKVKKETKWPNGQVHTVESEQYANALMLFYEKVKPTEVPDEPESDDEDDDDDKEEEAEKADGDEEPKKEEKKKKEKLVPPPKDIPLSTGYDVFEPDVRRSNATHRWQSFLFDNEFQAFMKNLLSFCRSVQAVVPSDNPEEPMQSPPMEWRASVIDTLLSFMFDIFLYSAEKPALTDWIRLFYEIFAHDPACAKRFVLELALKTKTVGSNWLRTYLSDCPDQNARHAAMRIFTIATQSCLSIAGEQTKLANWAKAWKNQINELYTNVTPLPCTLGGEWMTFESLKSGENQLASCIGVVLSFLNILLEASPRNWRFYPELCILIRNLSNTASQFGGNIIRTSMVESLMPARLVCLVIRDRAPTILRDSFPGCSVAADAAETQIRPEQSPTSHMMTIGNNQGIGSSEMNYRGGGGSPADHLPLFEALGCLMGLVGVAHEPLVIELEESGRGRPRFVLTEAAANALRTIFDGSHSSSTVGMGQRDIEAYLQRCGVDSASVPTQKIIDIMAKYPTTTGGKGGSYLSLEGFLAYYCDTAQSNEGRVRADLHTFGFRPNLTRRPRDTRLYSFQGREQDYPPEESVALDVMNLFGDEKPDIGKLAAHGLQSFHMYNTAYSASEAVAEYILAGSVHGRDTDSLIIGTLKAVYHAPGGWAGSETLGAAVMVLKVLASIRDERQRHRISLMMQCPERPNHHVDSGIGLLVSARAFSGPRPSQQHYQNDAQYAFDRYVSVLKELFRLHPVYMWMNENRGLWAWIERDILDTHHQHAAPQTHQGRSGYVSRRDTDGSAIPIDHHNHSDSDMPGINDSEDEDDDDSRLEEIEALRGPPCIEVRGAGQSAVNGAYTRTGLFEGACMYSRRGEFRGESCMFSLFKCNVSNNTKHWYISIVPLKGQPGTSADIDFYSAPVKENCTDVPPLIGWVTSTEGLSPSPTLTFKDVPVSDRIVV